MRDQRTQSAVDNQHKNNNKMMKNGRKVQKFNCCNQTEIPNRYATMNKIEARLMQMEEAVTNLSYAIQTLLLEVQMCKTNQTSSSLWQQQFYGKKKQINFRNEGEVRDFNKHNGRRNAYQEKQMVYSNYDKGPKKQKAKDIKKF